MRKPIESTTIYVSGYIPNMIKKEVKHILEEKGYLWHKTVDEFLDLLVIGYDGVGESKVHKALNLGIPILKWSEFQANNYEY